MVFPVNEKRSLLRSDKKKTINPYTGARNNGQILRTILLQSTLANVRRTHASCVVNRRFFQIIQLPQSFGHDRTLDYSDYKTSFTRQEF